MLERIDEKQIKNKRIIGCDIQSKEKKIHKIVDLIFSAEYRKTDIDYDFFGMNGTILLYGKPGVGKTTLAYNTFNYVLEQYEADVYTINLTEVIVADLGMATKNIKIDLDEFYEKKKGILFIDEIDKICINRESSGEISELKRMLIEVMGFMDKISYKDYKVVIGCTNVIGQIDEALKRRFTILEEIVEPTKEDKIKYINLCLKKLKVDHKINNLGNNFNKKMKTMDAINQYFKNILLEYDNSELENIIKMKMGEMEE